jgi:tetratricopeptide (TPR) repeat protein
MTDQAFICYDSALVYNPDETVSLNNYAYFLSLQGKNLEQALAMSARTLEKEPLNATYLDTYAWILFKLQRYEEALSYLEKALRYIDEDNADIYEHYGDVLYMCGEKEKALENWHRAVQLNSESTTIERKIKEEKYLE